MQAWALGAIKKKSRTSSMGLGNLRMTFHTMMLID
jgi:hypothetical protein